MAFQTVCVVGGVITVFGLLGHQILDHLHVSVPALIMLSAIAVQQIINGVTQVIQGSWVRPAHAEPPHGVGAVRGL